jgi:predicted enzyme related to lactoylglutathione lyase
MQLNRYSILAISFLACGAFLAGRLASSAPEPARTEPAEQVTGIGGIFFKARNPARLKAWYHDNLGIRAGKYGYDFAWREKDKPEVIGKTVWSLFPTNTTYLGSTSTQFMINYRVANMDRLLAQLRQCGTTVEKVEDVDYGRFAWLTDPEGNRIELWEPKGK